MIIIIEWVELDDELTSYEPVDNSVDNSVDSVDNSVDNFFVLLIKNFNITIECTMIV